MEETLFTIITPSYNSEKTIERTINSILSQTHQQFEYIIMDGGSTDHTVDIIKRYLPCFQGRMHYVSEKDSGIYDAMNKGIDMARGKLIGIVNSDDFYEPDCLQTVADAYNSREPYVILYGAVRYINQKGEELRIQICNHRGLPGDPLLHPAMFVSSSVYHDLFHFDTKYRYSSDYDFMIKAKHNEKIAFHPVYKVLSNFQAGGVSSTKKAYLETNRIWYHYGMISRGCYWRRVLLTKIEMALGMK